MNVSSVKVADMERLNVRSIGEREHYLYLIKLDEDIDSFSDFSFSQYYK